MSCDYFAVSAVGNIGDFRSCFISKSLCENKFSKLAPKYRKEESLLEKILFHLHLSNFCLVVDISGIIV